MGYKVSLVSCWPGTNAFRFSLVSGLERTSLGGVSESCFPAYLFSTGFGSNDSTCDTPPNMKSQITRLARGWKCGLPSGTIQLSSAAPAFFGSIAPSARPVRPIEVSERKTRLERRSEHNLESGMKALLSQSDKIVVVEQH